MISSNKNTKTKIHNFIKNDLILWKNKIPCIIIDLISNKGTNKKIWVVVEELFNDRKQHDDIYCFNEEYYKITLDFNYYILLEIKDNGYTKLLKIDSYNINNKEAIKNTINDLNNLNIKEDVPLPNDDNELFYKIKREKIKIEEKNLNNYVVVQLLSYTDFLTNKAYSKINSIYVI